MAPHFLTPLSSSHFVPGSGLRKAINIHSCLRPTALRCHRDGIYEKWHILSAFYGRAFAFLFQGIDRAARWLLLRFQHRRPPLRVKHFFRLVLSSSSEPSIKPADKQTQECGVCSRWSVFQWISIIISLYSIVEPRLGEVFRVTPTEKRSDGWGGNWNKVENYSCK